MPLFAFDAGPAYVRLDPAAGLGDEEHEIDVMQSTFINDGLAVNVNDNRWWVPREVVQYIRQPLPDPGPPAGDPEEG